MAKIAINGFGRIGRHTLRRILQNHTQLEVLAINDLTDTGTLAHLLKYDSVYRTYQEPVFARGQHIVVGKKEIQVLANEDPSNLPWKKLGVEVVIESTGRFTDLAGAQKHIEAGAKLVIVSAPAKDTTIPSFVMGVNEEDFDPKKAKVVDMGSCTTNCLAVIAKILHENFKIVKGFMTTAHSYTNDQKILDLPHKDLRRARAAALSIIPTTTGASVAIGKVIPELKGKVDGIALRVPTPTVSILDFIAQVEKPATAKAINAAFAKAAKEKSLQGIIEIEEQPLVSADYIGNTYSAVIDAQLTMAQDTLVKVVAWYDNEYGYATRLAEFTEFIARKL